MTVLRVHHKEQENKHGRKPCAYTPAPVNSAYAMVTFRSHILLWQV